MEQLALELIANSPIYAGLALLILEVRASRDDWRTRYDKLLEYVLEETDITNQDVYRLLNGK